MKEAIDTTWIGAAITRWRCWMSPAKETWVEITVTTPPQLTDALANFLEELGTQGVFQDEALQNESFNGLADRPDQAEIIKAYLPGDDATAGKLAELDRYLTSLEELFPDYSKPSYVTTEIVDPDWAERWKKYFKPLRISRNIVIKPTWERYSPEGGEIVIDIDPGMAFGTGQHASTRLCVNAIENIILKNRPVGGWNVLDVGTGTGILAMCCVRLGANRVIAIDLDQQAVEIATTNVAINDLKDSIEIQNRDVTMMDGSFNLIVANLTAPTFINIHEKLLSLLSPGGFLIASGITDMYISQIEKIFASDNIIIENRLAEKEWVCISFNKRDA